MLVRSQLDCYDPVKQITFDLKSRSTIQFRLGPRKFEQMVNDPDTMLGTVNLFERELYDMMKGVFLKYFFQVKLGKMVSVHSL